MYIITKCLYPTDKAKEVAQMYLKALSKYPDDPSVATPTVPAAVHSTLQGMSVMVIYEPKKGKLEEAYAMAVNRMVMFHDIQGFESTHETHYNLEEGMKVLGM
jgi:hypothetical protein